MNTASALLMLIAPRDCWEELPPPQSFRGAYCLVTSDSKLYVSTGSDWVLLDERNVQVRVVEEAQRIHVDAEVPERWHCRLTCGCTVDVNARTQRTQPDRVEHRCHQVT
jgi:hypothetical protein